MTTTRKPAVLKVLRNLIHDAIRDRQRAGGFVVNDCDLEQTHLPISQLPELQQGGKVWVIGLAGDDKIATRDHGFTREIPIQIALQKALDDNPRNLLDLIDDYVLLEEQLRDSVRLATKEHKHFAWQRTEALKDENGTPFSITKMREENMLEAYFTAYFLVGLV